MSSDLWAITSFFNPAGYRVRRRNYEIFRKHLPVPLLTVELAYGDRFELGAGDAEILVQRRGRDVLWQKERLLNLALEQLPAECDSVAWLDGDVLFQRDDWPDLLRRALAAAPIAQLFERTRDLPQGSDGAEDGQAAADQPQVASSGARAARGSDLAKSLRCIEHRSSRSFANGLAWGARRELLGRHRFYDACILGSGDRAMVAAAVGRLDAITDVLLVNEAQARHYLAWAEPFHASVRGRVGCIAGELLHLWHGEPARRIHGSRYRLIEPFQFDPHADLGLEPEGCWGWRSEKPEMHRAVRDYFRLRREDD